MQTSFQAIVNSFKYNYYCYNESKKKSII